MGASMGGGSGGRDSRRYRKNRFTEINVTPMVDVMLVLLIIFMVTAPLLTAGVQVELPKTQAAPITETMAPLEVSVQKNGAVFLQKEPIRVEDLGAKLKAVANEKTDTRIFVRGDKEVGYGTVMRVMGAINAAGFTKVALITEQTEESSSHHGR